MNIDMQLSQTGGYLLVAYWVCVGIFGTLRIGRPGSYKYLRDPNDTAIVAFWNFLDESKWNEEGIAVHRRWLTFLGFAIVSLIPVFLVLDAFTS